MMVYLHVIIDKCLVFTYMVTYTGDIIYIFFNSMLLKLKGWHGYKFVGDNIDKSETLTSAC